MKIRDQICNPYLPEYEYIPDGEPHVFGDRVYVFGSHDRFDGKKFCLNDYICYSAPVDDLTDWRYEGVIYKKTQDIRMKDGTHELWAPDVVRGKDGRYYLYYCPDDSILSIGVAVCNEPAGNYEFYGIVHDKNGDNIGERPGDTYQFDPGVFIDDDGEIYLYSGNGPRTRRDIGKEPKASVVMTLEDDMLTVKSGPEKLLPTLGESIETGFEGHEFFEASSIRKINGKYYLVYSSVTMHELCYAISDRPDSGFRFGGVIVSNTEGVNCIGNDHGGIEKIGGSWYIFYHRQTNSTMFSRQGCAEKIVIREDGTIPQAEITSQGLTGRPLEGNGVYPASMACFVYSKHRPVITNSLLMRGRFPYLTQSGPDTDPDEEGAKPRQFVTNMKDGMTVGFRYFKIFGLKRIGVKVRGRASGKLLIHSTDNGPVYGEIEITPSRRWHVCQADVKIPSGIRELRFTFKGSGKFDFLDFALDAR